MKTLYNITHPGRKERGEKRTQKNRLTKKKAGKKISMI